MNFTFTREDLVLSMRRENPRLFRARDESRFLTLIFDIMTDDFLRCITIAKSLSVIWHSKPTGLQPVGSSLQLFSDFKDFEILLL